MLRVKDLTMRLFEGTFEYSNNGENYSQENFVVFKNEENKTIVYRSEVLSRVQTGEFLKINVDYEVNNKWFPVRIEVKKSLGEDYACETFLINYDSNVLIYEFDDGKNKDMVERILPNKFQISTPCFLTSMLFSQSKKHNAMGRSQYNILRPNSDWKFDPEISDETLFAEFMTHEKTELKINNQTVTCVKVLLFKNDSAATIKEQPTVVYLSKHIGIPYMLQTEDGVVIKVKNLKKHENQYDNMF
jgi:hypothetical protein